MGVCGGPALERVASPAAVRFNLHHSGAGASVSGPAGRCGMAAVAVPRLRAAPNRNQPCGQRWISIVECTISPCTDSQSRTMAGVSRSSCVTSVSAQA